MGIGWITADPDPDPGVALLDHWIARELAERDAVGQLWRFTDTQLDGQLTQAQKELAKLQTRRLALLAEAEKREVTLKLTGLPTAGWLADRNTHWARSAREEVRLAVALERPPLVKDAFSLVRCREDSSGSCWHTMGDQVRQPRQPRRGTRRLGAPPGQRRWRQHHRYRTAAR